jgi:hypothetical protein
MSNVHDSTIRALDENMKSAALEILKSGPTNVTFTKQNGERREMYCTRKEDLIPVEFRESDTPKRKVADDIITVWDLDKNAWRSFKVDSVISIRT